MPDETKQIREHIDKIEKIADMNTVDIARLSAHLLGEQGRGRDGGK